MRTSKLITCILYKGGGEKVMQELYRQGVTRVGHIHARGSSIGDPVGKNGLPRQFEKEILQVVVEAERADAIFALIFEVAEIDRPHGGLMYLESLKSASEYTLPEARVEFETGP